MLSPYHGEDTSESNEVIIDKGLREGTREEEQKVEMIVEDHVKPSPREKPQ